MIRVANDEQLSIKQNDVQLKGWSIESRVYAEDPERNFMPSIGRLTHYDPPPETDTVRVDTGVFDGGEISMHYDPMIAKLVTYGETRSAAIEEMSNALDGYLIRGVSHNIPFLASVLQNSDFAAGEISTGFIEQHYPDGFQADQQQCSNVNWLLAVAVTLQHQSDDSANSYLQTQTREYSASLNRPSIFNSFYTIR